MIRLWLPVEHKQGRNCYTYYFKCYSSLLWYKSQAAGTNCASAWAPLFQIRTPAPLPIWVEEKFNSRNLPRSIKGCQNVLFRSVFVPLFLSFANVHSWHIYDQNVITLGSDWDANMNIRPALKCSTASR